MLNQFDGRQGVATGEGQMAPRSQLASAARLRGLALLVLAMVCSADAYAKEPSEGNEVRAPAMVADAGARLWERLDLAATQALQDGVGPRAHPIAIAEIMYPRSREESNAFGGQAVVLVTAMTDSRRDLAAVRVMFRASSGQEVALERVTGQTNYVGERSNAAVKVFGTLRYDGLFFISRKQMERVGEVTMSFNDSSERLVVLKVSPRESRGRKRWPVSVSGFTRAATGRVVATAYPFFRVPPLHAPADDVDCALEDRPEAESATATPPSQPSPPGAPSLVGPASTILSSEVPAWAGRWSSKLALGFLDNHRRGSLDKEVIRAEIRTHLDEVRSCYEESLDTGAWLKGNVVVEFIIDADGRVIASSLHESSTLFSTSLDYCIVAVVRCWRFPSPEGGGIVRVTYPFVLTSDAYDRPPKSAR